MSDKLAPDKDPTFFEAETLSKKEAEEILKELEYGKEIPEDKEPDVVYDESGNPVDVLHDGEIYTKEIPLEDIVIPPRARTRGIIHTSKLEMNIMFWGLISPLHVIPYGDKYVLIDGYRRYKALKNLNYDHVICLVDETRPKEVVRFLEVIENNTIHYDFLEIIDFGEFIEKKQETFQNETIENIIGLEVGDYVKAKYLFNYDEFGLIDDVLMGKYTIKDAFEKLERNLKKQRKKEKELEELELQGRVIPEDYDEFSEKKYDVQDTKDRKILPKGIRDKVNARDNFTCQSCGAGHDHPELTSIFEKHHLIPVARGGSDDPNNLALLCANCHKIVHAYVDGDFTPPKEIIEDYKNLIILGNIILKGVSEATTPYDFYVSKRDKFWG